MRLTLLIAITTVLTNVYAAEFDLDIPALHLDARGLAMGGIVCESDYTSRTSLELTYLIPYQVKELSIRKSTVRFPIGGFRAKIGWHQSGNEDWMENYFYMNVGKKLNDLLFLGIGVNLITIQEVYQSNGFTFFPELSCNYEIAKNVLLCLLLNNPSGASFRLNDSWIPMNCSAHLGIMFLPTPSCQLAAETVAELHHPLRLKFGMEYGWSELFKIRLGWSSFPSMPSWGIGGTLSHVDYSWGGNLHPVLGLSNGVTIRYLW